MVLAAEHEATQSWHLATRAGTFLTRVLTQRFAWAPFAVLLVYSTGVQLWYHGGDLMHWDMLELSGWATLVVGLVAAQRVPDRLHATLARLVDRGVLVVPDDDLSPVYRELESHSQHWATRTGTITAVAMFLAFAFAVARVSQVLEFGLLLPFEMAGGFVAGFHLGRLASYGRLGKVLRNAHCSLHSCPGHIDQAAGLKPIGDFFFRQAMIAGIPAAFVAVWWVIIPFWGSVYSGWRRPYLGLLVFAITLEVLAFLVPMLTFHQEMAQQKRKFLCQADRLSIEITQLAAIPSAKDQLAASTERYAALEGMPTWPIDARTRRRFRLSNVVLVLPLVGQALGTTELSKQIANVLKGYM